MFGHIADDRFQHGLGQGLALNLGAYRFQAVRPPRLFQCHLRAFGKPQTAKGVG